MPVLSIPEEQLARPGSLDPASLFAEPRNPVWMEIGFGNGEHLLALLRSRPDVNFLSAEPFIDGMAAFLKSLSEENKIRHPVEKRDLQIKGQDPGFRRDDDLSNIRVLMDDALLLIHALKDESLARLYILNPDPWPKRRHHKRRIVNRENLAEFCRVLKPGAEIVMATDVDDMAEWMVTQCMNHPGLEWTAQSAKDWKTPPPEWTETRYACKGRTAGRNQSFLIFRKK